MTPSPRGPEPAISLLSEQTLFRDGVSELLNRHGYHRVADFSTERELRAAAVHRPPDIVMVDLDHEGDDTMTLIRGLRRELPRTHLVVIGTAARQAAADAAADDALETPGAGKLELVAATRGRKRPRSVEVIRESRRWAHVTARQRDVMRWLAIGLDNGAIARELRIGGRAVKLHVTKLLDTFQLTNRTELALLAYRAGLRPPTARAPTTKAIR